MSIQLHPRHTKVSEARNQLASTIRDILRNHDLTYAELNSILCDEMRVWIGFAIRDERGV